MVVLENSLRQVIDDAPVAMAFVARDGRITYVNRAACALMGRDETALLASTWDDLVLPDDLDIGRHRLPALLAGDIVRARKRYVRGDATPFWAEAAISCVRDESGDPMFHVIQLVDVTTEVATRDELAASEGRYRLLAENASDVVSVLKVDGTLEWVSPSVHTLLGWDPAELVGHQPWNLVHSDDIAAAVAALSASVDSSHEPPSVTVRVRRSDGTYAWTSTSGRRLSDEQVLVSYRLVDEQVRAEQALAESERRYRLLAENASDVVYSAGPDRLITWVSPSVTHVLGWSPDDLIGTEMPALVHPEDQHVIAAVRERLYRGEAVGNPRGGYVTRMRTKNGTYVWMASNVTALTDEAGHPAGIVGGLTLVQDLVEQRARAEEDEELLRISADAMLDPQVLLDAVRDDTGRIIDFTYLTVNRATADYLGIAREDLVGSRMLDTLPGMAAAGLLDRYAAVMETREPLALDAFAYHNELLETDAYYDIRVAYVTGGRLSLTWRDVTALHEATRRIEQSEEQYRLLAENSSDVVLRVDAANVCTWVSPSITDMLGWTPEDWIGHPIMDFAHPDDLTQFLADSESMLTGRMPLQHGAWIARYRSPAKDGRYHWIETHTRLFIDADGQPDGAIVSFRVVDAEVEAERELEHRARFDDLTGLFKREEILERLAEAGRYTRRTGEQVGVVFCDVDSFKDVNDSYGHTSGDELLRALSRRIRNSVRAGDTVARMGGDEFLVVLDGVHNLDEAHAIAEKIRIACAEPVSTRAGEVHATVSIGVTLCRPGEDVDAMITRADRAMYEAKRQGRNQVLSVPIT